MDELQILIDTLDYSIKKNGEVPLTNKYLFNILNIVKERAEELDFEYSLPSDMEF